MGGDTGPAARNEIQVTDERLVCGDKRGTYAGWNQHNVRGDKPCVECRAAATEYQRKRRLRPGGRDYDRRRQMAYDRALALLMQRHPDEFGRLYSVERALQGLPAEPGMSGWQ